VKLSIATEGEVTGPGFDTLLAVSRRIRAAAAYFAAFCLFFAVAASSAFAGSDGQGLLGETNDKQVTFISLGVVLFFVFVVVFGSIVQGRLERRKEEKQAARMRQRTGW
jgi:hypothetical protein